MSVQFVNEFLEESSVHVSFSEIALPDHTGERRTVVIGFSRNNCRLLNIPSS